MPFPVQALHTCSCQVKKREIINQHFHLALSASSLANMCNHIRMSEISARARRLFSGPVLDEHHSVVTSSCQDLTHPKQMRTLMMLARLKLSELRKAVVAQCGLGMLPPVSVCLSSQKVQ